MCGPQRTRGVSTNCGHSAHMRMPSCCIRPGAMERTKLTTPALAAAYTGAGGMGKTPAAEPVPTITPARQHHLQVSMRRSGGISPAKRLRAASRAHQQQSGWTQTTSAALQFPSWRPCSRSTKVVAGRVTSPWVYGPASMKASTSLRYHQVSDLGFIELLLPVLTAQGYPCCRVCVLRNGKQLELPCDGLDLWCPWPAWPQQRAECQGGRP